MLRSAAKSPRTAIPVKGSSSTSCPNGIAHDALHIVNSHRAFARAIEAEIAKLNAALGYFSPLSHSSRLRSFVPSLPTPIRGGGLRAKLSKKHKCTGGERVTIWSDIGKIICMYDWLWTYSYSASVKNWQEVIWACAVVTGVYGAGGLEGVNARMRDYGISHAGVVDSLYVAYRAREKEAEKRQALVTRIGNQMINTMQDGPKKRVIVKRRRMTKVDGKWVQVDPRVIAAQVKEGEMVNGLQVGAGCTDRRWKVKVQVPGGVMAVGLKIKILRKIIKGKEKEKCRREARGEAEGAIKEDLSDEEYEKAMWG
ncbi:hypothetical protein C7212DRAFT_347125 [Tuber magnatum]|uniref:Uncharacterized protein n=1 Tax=Tuber magnatum TaxID=42249 RepID=A0A317SGJ5_9PEZI|nr:hypothetical protein C7212DRAFT_347125 [Tuber magnatum]